MTRAKASSKATPVAKLGKKTVYVTVTGGVRVGADGLVYTPSELFSGMDKGEARKLRKALRGAGHGGIASAPRF